MDSPKLGSSTEENRPAPSENVDTFGPEEKKKKGRNPVLMMVLVLGVGLLVSLAYLGGRISSAHASVAAVKPGAFSGGKEGAASGTAVGARSLTVAARKEETVVAAPVVTKEVAKVTPAVVPAVTKEVAKLTPAAAPAVTKEVAKLTPLAVPAVTKEAAKVTPPAVPAVTKEAAKVTPAAVPAVTKEAAKVTPLAVPAVTKEAAKVTPAATTESSANLVHPKPGVAYVQVGAFVSPYAENWVGVLTKRGFHPFVAEGPNSAVHRVLLGPFGPAAVAEVETKLRASGIDHFERIY